MVERLEELRKKHNIILVTNDHVDTLTKLADNTITVSAVDRTKVKVGDKEGIDRQRAIFALSLGDEFQYTSTSEDLKFFLDAEIFSNPALIGLFMFSLISFSFFIMTYWDSSPDMASLVVVAGGIIAYFCINPYLLSLVEWRNMMEEEAEALMHSSKGMNRTLKSCLCVAFIFLISWAEFGVVNATISGLSSFDFWVAMFFDSASLTFPMICTGIYTHLDFQTAQILGSLPFLLMIFFSTTFSPGAGLEGIKELRYLFARFYFWCMLPDVGDDMEGCPDNLNLLYLILSALVGLVLFLFIQLILMIKSKSASIEAQKLKESMLDQEFHDLQVALYGEKAIKRFNHMQSSLHSRGSDTPKIEDA